MGRRYAVARRLAGLFASYAGSGRSCSSTGRTTPPASSTPTSTGSRPCGARCWTASTPTRRTSGTRKPLVTLQESPTDLPERISLFGHTRLPSTEIELLDALSDPSRPAPVAAAPQRQPVAVARRRPRPDPPPRRHQPPRGRASAAGHPRPRPSRTPTRPAAGPADRRIPRRRRPPRHAAGLAAVRHHRQRRTTRRPHAEARRPLGAGAQLPRPRPPDRRPA